MTPVEKTEREDILRAAHDWRFRIEAPDATDADRAAFEAWRAADPRHGDLYDYAVTFYHALGTLDAGDLDDDVLRRTPLEYLTQLRYRLAGLFGQTQYRLAAAGATALIVAAVVVTTLGRDPGMIAKQPVLARYETAIGETEAVTLSDGTVITLGAASTVETAYSNAARQATLLSGAAFFDVAHQPGRPFSVEAGALEARVLGTVFDVSRSKDTVRVAVAEGEVEVSYPLLLNQKPTALRARRSLTQGQQIAASTNEGLEPVRAINVAAIGAWRDDKLFYDGARLAELVADANRYSDARVIIDGDDKTIANFRVRGSFNARDTDTMLSTLADVYPVEIDRSEAGVIRIRSRTETER